ncbi:MAG: prolipoprotein diacylglyceryl transferase [Deltaproteobacteria bacterium]|jgi:phosphatidylglycerol:prolipoprotein diacylglycerol transferase|nr:prolipoprotein diacylglyceryl transferase [Deltaproteobacteria bacterium]
MIPFPNIDPNIVELGPFKLRWYGLMYVLGFVSAYFLIGVQEGARRLGLQGKMLQDLIFYMALGLVAGARLGYIFFYQFANLGYYATHPLEIIAVWHGGMSFHGGLIGAVLAAILFCRIHKLPFLQVADAVIVTVPVGLFFGRMGNFINGELYGRPTSVPWAMVFPASPGVPRHPSQLYEAGLEGVVLFIILWMLKDRIEKPGAMVAIFLGGYGVMRFIIEFFREPDAQIGLFMGLFSMGQFLCMAMIVASVILFLLLPHRGK